MNKLLIALPLIALLSLGAVIVFTHKSEVEMGRNQTTVFQWFSCFNQNTQHQCEELKDEADKTSCNTAAHFVGQYTYDGSPDALEPCQKFHAFLKNATTSDVLNTENYYQDCYINPTILKAAYQNAFYNNTVYYPLYINCAGF